jgi:hypothetical protein
MDRRTRSCFTGTAACRLITAANAVERITGRCHRTLARWVTTLLLA